MKRVVVKIRELPIPRELIGGDYTSDPEFRDSVRAWVNQLWREKDDMLEALRRKWK